MKIIGKSQIVNVFEVVLKICSYFMVRHGASLVDEDEIASFDWFESV